MSSTISSPPRSGYSLPMKVRVLLSVLFLVACRGEAQPTATTTAEVPVATEQGRPTVYTAEIINTYPHDQEAFTQGLFFAGGVLYEST
ncbi:MAG: glutaminyl-peptide cyclotransferase, partial [Pseudomonadota bacterium]